MKKLTWWLILIVGICVFGAIFYNAFQKMRPKPQPIPPAATPAPPVPPAEPQIRFPVPEKPQEQPLPALNESDSAMTGAIDDLWTDRTLAQLLHPQEFIRRVVATIDNLPRKKLPLRLLPFKPVAGTFTFSGNDETLAIARENAKRYAPYARLSEAVDAKKLVALYVRFYPLFQQAYQELGYPKGYFNDRLIEVIDHLLAAPEVQPPIKLVRPKVFYLFADPELEARSAGQKIMMRIGHENELRIKTKLREIRGELTHEKPKP